MKTNVKTNVQTKELLGRLNDFAATKYALILFDKRVKGVRWLNEEEGKAREKAQDEYHKKLAELQKTYDEQRLQVQEEDLRITAKYKAKKITPDIYDEELGRLANQLKNSEADLPKKKEKLAEDFESALERIKCEFGAKKANLIESIDKTFFLHKQACHWGIKDNILHFLDVKLLPPSFETDEQIREAFGKDCITFEIFGLKRVLFKISAEMPEFANEEDKYTWILNKLRRNSLTTTVIGEEWAD